MEWKAYEVMAYAITFKKKDLYMPCEAMALSTQLLQNASYFSHSQMQ